MVHTCNYSTGILTEKPTFGRLHCYGTPSSAALQRHSDDCASMTEPRWHHCCWQNFQFFLVASYIALGHIQTTPSREYVAEASCLADWLGQTTAPFSVAYLRTMVFLGTFVYQRVRESPLRHWALSQTCCERNLQTKGDGSSKLYIEI